jgi:hypothetical protein
LTFLLGGSFFGPWRVLKNSRRMAAKVAQQKLHTSRGSFAERVSSIGGHSCAQQAENGAVAVRVGGQSMNRMFTIPAAGDEAYHSAKLCADCCGHF